MSSGLRYMFDRNKHHYLVSTLIQKIVTSVLTRTIQAIVYKGWKPPTATIIILAVSLGLMYVKLVQFSA